MQQLTVGEIKARFSDILAQVEQGESVAITYGKKKKKVAAIVPYKKRTKGKALKLGLLEGKATFKIHKDFKMTDEEFLHS